MGSKKPDASTAGPPGCAWLVRAWARATAAPDLRHDPDRRPFVHGRRRPLHERWLWRARPCSSGSTAASVIAGFWSRRVIGRSASRRSTPAVRSASMCRRRRAPPPAFARRASARAVATSARALQTDCRSQCGLRLCRPLGRGGRRADQLGEQQLHPHVPRCRAERCECGDDGLAACLQHQSRHSAPRLQGDDEARGFPQVQGRPLGSLCFEVPIGGGRRLYALGAQELELSGVGAAWARTPVPAASSRTAKAHAIRASPNRPSPCDHRTLVLGPAGLRRA